MLGFFMTILLIGSLAQGNILKAQLTSGPNTFSSDKSMSDQEIVQALFEGIFFENRLEGPFQVKYCFNPQISHQTVSFLNDSLPQAAKATPLDLTMLILETKQFVQGLPYTFLECLVRCDEIRTLGQLYDIDGSTDAKSLVEKVSQYFALHYLVVHRWAVDLNTRWQQEDYIDVGYYMAVDAHKVQYWRPNTAKKTQESFQK